jgi:hypothetical protein
MFLMALNETARLIFLDNWSWFKLALISACVSSVKIVSTLEI